MFPYNESEWEFISVIKDNRYKIKMTVRFLIYVAITAFTRLLLESVNDWHNLNYNNLLIICGGILILAVSILVLRYASNRYP